MITTHTIYLDKLKRSILSGCLLMAGVILGIVLIMLAAAAISYNALSWRLTS
jgi:hypothetical protein